MAHQTDLFGKASKVFHGRGRRQNIFEDWFARASMREQQVVHLRWLDRRIRQLFEIVEVFDFQFFTRPEHSLARVRIKIIHIYPWSS